MTTLHSFRVRLFGNVNVDFIRLRRWAYAATAALIVPGVIMLAAKGATYSIEFTGGAMVQLHTEAPIEPGRLRAALERGGVVNPEVQSFGSPRDYVVRARLETAAGVHSQAEAVGGLVRSALDRELGAGTYEVVRSEGVTPKVSGELQEKALIAILLSFAVTLIYLAFRFEWRFGLAAVVATAHDILATIAFIRYLNLEVSLVVVAALHTVVG